MKVNLTLLLLFIGLGLSAQDTITIQTLNYDDITKRRDFYVFPDGSESYRKVIMSYSLKCDPRTTQDRFDCGEWDYLTYTYLYDKSGRWDSTRQSGVNFRVNGAVRNNFEYVTRPQYSILRDKHYSVTRDSVYSLNTASTGPGLGNLPVLSGEKSLRLQSIYRASELAAAGLNAGNITGMDLLLNGAISAPHVLEIRMAHTGLDSIVSPISANFQSLYKSNTAAGPSTSLNLQFHNSFNWNGSDNLVLEILLDHSASVAWNNSTFDLKSDPTSYPSSLVLSGTDYAIDFAKNSQQINLGRIAELDGSSHKTIEAWVYTREYNNAGVWQAGRRGAVGEDFSLRTRTGDNQWRVQHWGAPDYDFTANTKASWHHVAVTYDGNTSKVYVDGQLSAQKGASLNTGNQDMILGRWQGSFFNGIVDEVRVWSAALNQNTIQEWMNKSPNAQHPNQSDLVRYLPMNGAYDDFTIDGKTGASYYLQNYPWWYAKSSKELHLNPLIHNERPSLTFEQGVYDSRLDSSMVDDTVQARPLQMTLFNNPANGTVIATNAPNHPSLATDTLKVWEANTYFYVYDKQTGAKLDSMNSGAGQLINREDKEWFISDARFEIGRFITPYGINLTHPQINSAEGYTWTYDVTDYAPLFRDTVEISAGNQQELIDLKFIFIKGTPPRDVLGIKRIWGQNASYSYANLDNDVSLSETSIDLDPAAESFKVKTRFTGHGHNSSNGNYPHCCEWKDNEHYLMVNGRMVEAWHIWQATECAQNPLYPQGGTWPGAREGWCPGDKVKDFDFEIGKHVTGNSVSLDYDITDVPADNPGMGGGNYQVAMHLISYAAQNFSVDAELLDIISPNDQAYYDRVSLVCGQPKVMIRNNGSSDLTSLNIYYGVSGGQELLYEWKGRLEPNQSEEVELLVEGNWFWSGDNSKRFYARVGEPNNHTDQYAANDRLETRIEEPDHYTGKLVFHLTTNNNPQDNDFVLRSLTGNTIMTKTGLAANTVYRDTMDLAEGCYYFELSDRGHDGLSYWANSAQGSGSIRIFILNENNQIQGLKNFGSDFGNVLHYNFTIDKKLGDYPNTGLAEKDKMRSLEVYPNPTSNQVNLELIGLEDAEAIELLDISGRTLKEQRLSGTNFQEITVDLTKLPAGIYVVQTRGAQKNLQQRIIKH